MPQICGAVDIRQLGSDDEGSDDLFVAGLVEKSIIEMTEFSKASSFTTNKR